jgi:uncharacterized protein (DUF427 family)
VNQGKEIMTTITVKDVIHNEVLAQGTVDDGIIALEDGYYFAPEQVKRDNLIISPRTYTCPYKGVCYWIDLQGPAGIIRDVGWTYFKPDPNYEYIRDKLGFAFGMRPGVIVEKT